MKKLFAIGVLVAGSAIAFPALAGENLSLKQAMTKFGLIGEWAAHCSQPPSKDNAHTHWSANSDTKGQLLTDFGDQTMTYDATLAELVGAARIRLQVVDNRNATQLELIIEKREGRVRTLSSVRSDGSALIKDGKFVSSGADTVAQQHCN
jgi:hypothetical protein